MRTWINRKPNDWILTSQIKNNCFDKIRLYRLLLFVSYLTYAHCCVAPHEYGAWFLASFSREKTHRCDYVCVRNALTFQLINAVNKNKIEHFFSSYFTWRRPSSFAPLSKSWDKKKIINYSRFLWTYFFILNVTTVFSN